MAHVAHGASLTLEAGFSFCRRRVGRRSAVYVSVAVMAQLRA